jgi:hypothetical protein
MNSGKELKIPSFTSVGTYASQKLTIFRASRANRSDFSMQPGLGLAFESKAQERALGSTRPQLGKGPLRLSFLIFKTWQADHLDSVAWGALAAAAIHK